MQLSASESEPAKVSKAGSRAKSTRAATAKARTSAKPQRYPGLPRAGLRRVLQTAAKVEKQRLPVPSTQSHRQVYDATLMSDVEWCVTEPPERARQGQDASADREVADDAQACVFSEADTMVMRGGTDLDLLFPQDRNDILPPMRRTITAGSTGLSCWDILCLVSRFYLEALPMDPSMIGSGDESYELLDAGLRNRAKTRGDLLENCCQWEGLTRVSDTGQSPVYAVQLTG
ncbi:hypothetical protein WJX73_006185 [Symbiochloris irregularis]|uniref:Uncharacterized protein n=1 Tax=Symbiochloris irregularis TaxID=706552 RepID=A0AAW1P547_9CHLO